MDEKEVARATARLLNAMCDDPEMMQVLVVNLVPHVLEQLAAYHAYVLARRADVPTQNPFSGARS